MPMLRIPFLLSSAASSSAPLRRRAIRKKIGLSTTLEIPNQKRLTSRIVGLTRRRQLRQVAAQQGYILSGSPLAAFTVYNDSLRQGLDADRLTYDTLVFACVKAGNLVTAMQFFEHMKENRHEEVHPDAVTYTTLLKGFGDSEDLDSVLRIIIAMKSQYNLAIDRTAYTATIDALLSCGFVKGALCIRGIRKKYKMVVVVSTTILTSTLTPV